MNVYDCSERKKKQQKAQSTDTITFSSCCRRVVHLNVCLWYGLHSVQRSPVFIDDI